MLASRSFSQMQSLTSCQCSVCCDCFQQHFTIVVRDKHIRDMVCPVCWEPDINDPEHLNSYFSTLDIQVRRSQLRRRYPHQSLTLFVGLCFQASEDISCCSNREFWQYFGTFFAIASVSVTYQPQPLFSYQMI